MANISVPLFPFRVNVELFSSCADAHSFAITRTHTHVRTLSLSHREKFNFPGYRHKQKTQKFLLSYSLQREKVEKFEEMPEILLRGFDFLFLVFLDSQFVVSLLRPRKVLLWSLLTTGIC